MISTYDFQLEHPEMFSHLLVKYLRLLHYKYPRQKNIANRYTLFKKFIFELEGKKMNNQFTNSGCKKNVTEIALRIGSAISEIRYHRSL